MDQSAVQPLISVALCTYNGARYLREQLDSLFAQDYGPLEIVAVDDGSSDDTVQILESYRLRHPNLQVVINQRNLGVRDNFQKALQLCRGEFIAPCDQDDIWLPHKLSTLQRVIGGHAMAYCDSELVDTDGRSLGTRMSSRWRMHDINDPAALIFDNCVSGHAMLLRRSLLPRACPMQEGFLHDWWLAVVAAAEGGVVFHPEVLVHYRRHEQTVTALPGSAEAQRRRAGIERRGVALRRHAVIAARLNAVAHLPGEPGRFCQQLQRLWSEHQRQWLSPALAGVLISNTNRLYQFKRVPGWRLALKSLRYAVGVRLLQVAGQQRYLE
ncbi:MAG: glycosyltransferase family 2 protein [Steroidobacteraceae bacterium]